MFGISLSAQAIKTEHTTAAGSDLHEKKKQMDDLTSLKKDKRSNRQLTIWLQMKARYEEQNQIQWDALLYQSVQTTKIPHDQIQTPLPK